MQLVVTHHKGNRYSNFRAWQGIQVPSATAPFCLFTQTTINATPNGVSGDTVTFASDPGWGSGDTVRVNGAIGNLGDRNYWVSRVSATSYSFHTAFNGVWDGTTGIVVLAGTEANSPTDRFTRWKWFEGGGSNKLYAFRDDAWTIDPSDVSGTPRAPTRTDRTNQQAYDAENATYGSGGAYNVGIGPFGELAPSNAALYADFGYNDSAYVVPMPEGRVSLGGCALGAEPL